MALLFLKTGPYFIQEWQHNLKGWVPTVPGDAVWGCARSMIVSGVTTAVYTHGNIFAAAKAAILAAVASGVYTTIQSLPLIEALVSKIQVVKNNWVRVQHGIPLVAVFSSYLLGRKIDMKLGWTLLATVIPYILTHSQNSSSLSTPLFITVVS